MRDFDLAGLARFASDHLGLRCPPDRWVEIARTLQASSASLGFESVADCTRWLIAGPPDRARIDLVARLLTNGETHFFRDPAGLDALEHHVIRAIAAERRAAGPDARTIRIWSAGCATGEEPYTVAMQLERAIPDLEAWRVTLLATDVNTEFLNAAQRGLYRDWSFRGVPAGIRETFFRRQDDGRFEIAAHLRRRVTFAALNLASDAYPAADNGTQGMDVILCRNVLMYLDPVRAREVVRRLAAALRDGGWLIVAAAECSQAAFAAFEAVRLPGATLYRKRPRQDAVEPPPTGVRRPARSSDRAASPRPAPTSDLQPVGTRDQAAALLGAGRHDDALRKAEGGLAQRPDDRDLTLLLARIHADRGDLEQALRYAHEATAVHKLDAAAHYAHASILMELGRRGEATLALRRTVYLSPDHALAHYWLGALAYDEAKPSHARKHLDNALAALAGRNPSDGVPQVEGLSVAGLIEIVRSTRRRDGLGAPADAPSPAEGR